MKTVGEVINRAMVLLGYTDQFGTPDSEQYIAMYKRGIDFTNAICTDLARLENKTFKDFISVDDEILLSEVTVNDIVPYGVAMWLAQSDNDGDNQQLFAGLYNAKRATTPRPQRTVTAKYPIE